MDCMDCFLYDTVQTNVKCDTKIDWNHASEVHSSKILVGSLNWCQ